MNSQKVDSTNYLDPDFVRELQATSKLYDANQEMADDNKWTIARLVNELWPEHKTLTWDGFTTDLVYPTKLDFLVACSYQANQGLKKARFSFSGETLRRWCEVQATYAPFKEAELLLSETSFEHLRIAKSLAYNEKAKTPLHALKWAIENGANAEDMKQHFDPPGQVAIYDRFVGWIDSLWNTKLEFFKIKEDRDEARRLIAALRGIVERNR